jgi:protein TonB
MRKTALALGLLAVAGTIAVGQILVPQPDEDGVYSMGVGMTPATLIHAVPAEYPKDPSLLAVKHVVALRLVVGADGTPGAIEVVNAQPSPFDDAAIAAAKGSQFAPAKYKGNPVPTRKVLWVPFLGDVNSAVPVVASVTTKGVSPPIALNSVKAEFPKEAGKKAHQGVVLIHILVTEEGLPSDIRVLWPAGQEFDEDLLKAAGKSRFSPAKLHGVPAPFDITVEMNFVRY